MTLFIYWLIFVEFLFFLCYYISAVGIKAADLKYLYKKGDSATAGELATALEVSTARIALLLKKLEAKNYITRMKDQNDGRIVVVNLTLEGKVYTEKKMMSFVDYIKKIICKNEKNTPFEKGVFFHFYRFAANANASSI